LLHFLKNKAKKIGRMCTHIEFVTLLFSYLNLFLSTRYMCYLYWNLGAIL